jgi:Lrp/AsnC family leucine-responsive transcriptional regulator
MASARSTRERPLDLLDRKILAVLAADGRATLAEVAERVGLSQSPCWTRLRRLEERRVITGYAALIDHKALGFTNIVFVEVTLDSHNEDRVAAFGAALVKLPEVLEAHLVTGDYDYLVKIAVSGTDHYEAFLRDKLYKIKGIRNSRSMFGLRALKHVASVDPMLVVD